MRLQPLGAHRKEVVFGKPLPFGICDADGRLLLARGHAIQSEAQLEALLDRGAFVDRSGGHDPSQRVANARGDELPGLWDSGIDQIGHLLRASADRGDFTSALEQASEPVIALIQRDPDLAIFQVVQQAEGTARQYASRHAVHTGIAAYLAAKRLNWSASDIKTTFRAALTMNISMVELQNRLANQLTPLTTMQRDQIRQHPERSVEILQSSGVTCADWLNAVAQHHEYGDGTGYPNGNGGGDCCVLAQMLQRADVFTAKFSTRAQRKPLAPDAAARSLYLRDPGHPFSAALIKEFGLYPPGCTVRLQSGEMGVVARRGETANAPVVVVLVNRSGEPLITPIRRLTSQAGHGIAAVLPPTAIKVQLSLEKIVAFAG